MKIFLGIITTFLLLAMYEENEQKNKEAYTMPLAVAIAAMCLMWLLPMLL